MKKFSFPLDRVLTWRRTQVRLAEADLDRARADVRTIQDRLFALDQSVHAERAQLAASRQTTTVELAALEHYRAAAATQSARLTHQMRAAEQKVAEQTRVVLDRRREARLLEQLRERRFEDWRAAAAREVEQVAEESYLSRLVRQSTT